MYSLAFYDARMSVAEANTRKLNDQDRLLADQIREFREKKGLSQQELSRMVGRYDSYISYIEEYRRGLSLTSVYDIARALEIKVGNLFTF